MNLSFEGRTDQEKNPLPHLPPQPLLLAAFALVFQAFLLRGAGGARGAARPGRDGGFGEGGAEFLEAVGDVSALVAEAAARDDDVALPRHAARVARPEPLLHRLGRALRRRHVPAQHRLGRDLVHVLPAGAARAREAEVDFAQGDAEPLVHDEHGNPPGGVGGSDPIDECGPDATGEGGLLKKAPDRVNATPMKGEPHQTNPPTPPLSGSIPTEEGGFASRCVSRQWIMQTLVPHSRLTPDKGG